MDQIGSRILFSLLSKKLEITGGTNVCVFAKNAAEGKWIGLNTELL